MESIGEGIKREVPALHGQCSGRLLLEGVVYCVNPIPQNTSK